jgi:hypothetical protein
VDIHFPQQHLLKRVPFFHHVFGLLCQRSFGCRCMFLCLALLFWSIGLPVCFCANTMLFVLLWIFNRVWSWVLWCLQHWVFLRIALAIQGLLCFICISRLIFLFLCRMSLDFW